VRSTYEGEEEPDTYCEVWPEPLLLQGRLGLKLSDGQTIFEESILQERSTSFKSLGTVSPTYDTAGKHSQPSTSAAETSLCYHLQQTRVAVQQKTAFASGGSQWWAASSAAIDRTGQHSCHIQASRQENGRGEYTKADQASSTHSSPPIDRAGQQRFYSQVSRHGNGCARGQYTTAYQASSIQHCSNVLPHSHQESAIDEEAAAVAELDGLLDSLEGPELSRALPLPAMNGHRRPTKQSGGTCNHAASRRGPSEDSAPVSGSAAPPVRDARHVSIMSALQSIKPAGLVELWKEAGQHSSSHEASASSSSSSSSQTQFLHHQNAYASARSQQMLQVSILSFTVSLGKAPTRFTHALEAYPEGELLVKLLTLLHRK